MKKGTDYIGVAVMPYIHDGKGKYLCGLRTDKCRDEQNTWETTGGGGVRVGESLEAALIREMKEEVNATPKNIEYLGHDEFFRESKNGKTHWLAFNYRVEVDPVHIKIMEPDMCAELRWCEIDSIPKPMHSVMGFVLDKYKDKLL